jgi:hypothetical protein
VRTYRYHCCSDPKRSAGPGSLVYGVSVVYLVILVIVVLITGLGG